jgi:hypothetical protein
MNSMSMMIRRLVTLGIIVCAAAVAMLPSQAMAGNDGRPVIIDTSVAIGGEVTVGAEIDPEGHATTYEVVLECGPDEPVSCGSLPAERVVGSLPSAYAAQAVRLTLTGLQPGKYWFGVRASNEAGETVQLGNAVEVPPPSPCADGCPGGSGPPYDPPVSKESLEQADKYGEEAPERQAAREQAAREQAEREAAEKINDLPASARIVSQTPSSSPSPGGSVSLVSTSVIVQGNDVALVKLNCLDTNSCQGKLTLTAKVASGAKGKSKGNGEDGKSARVAIAGATTTIGALGFIIAGNETKMVKISLNAAGRALLNSAHGYHLSAELTILKSSPSPAQTSTENVRLVRARSTTGKES